jgi:hypothetical protein
VEREERVSEQGSRACVPCVLSCSPRAVSVNTGAKDSVLSPAATSSLSSACFNALCRWRCRYSDATAPPWPSNTAVWGGGRSSMGGGVRSQKWTCHRPQSTAQQQRSARRLTRVCVPPKQMRQHYQRVLLLLPLAHSQRAAERDLSSTRLGGGRPHAQGWPAGVATPPGAVYNTWWCPAVAERSREAGGVGPPRTTLCRCRLLPLPRCRPVTARACGHGGGQPRQHTPRPAEWLGLFPKVPPQRSPPCPRPCIRRDGLVPYLWEGRCEPSWQQAPAERG